MLKTRARRKTKCLRNDKHALACEQALHLGSHETSRESHTRKETRVQRKGERKDLKTTTVIDPLYSNKKKMENVELFREFLNYKMAGTSCYIFLLVFFFVILACAQVLLWQLSITLEQMLPAGVVYFRPVMYSKLPRKPNVELIFYSGLQFFGFSSSSFRKSAEFVLSLGKLHWFPSLRQPFFYEPSVLTFRYFGDRISWKTWCWNENDGG